MTCDPERLSNYLDGELSPREVQELQDHLTGCEQCSKQLASYRRIDEQLRRFSPASPPRSLRRSIYAKLEARRRSRVRSRILTAALPLTAAVVIVAGVAAWRLVPMGAAPVMTAAFAVQEQPDSLEGLRLELVFDRPVSAESLARAVLVEPPLPLAQRVLDNKVELIPEVPVAAGSSYRLIIANVSDHRGNIQSTPVVLSLKSGPTAAVIQESPPAEPLPTPATAGPARRAEGAQLAVSPTAVIEAARAAAAALAPSLAPHATVTAVQRPAASPAGGSAVGAAASPRTLLGNPRAESAPASAPVRSASVVFDAYPELGTQLGSPQGEERSVQVVEQAFQGGAMLRRSDAKQVITLVRSSAQWLSFPSTWRGGEVLPAAGPRPAGTLEPLRDFGKVWREQPAVKLQLGWPVYEERAAAWAVLELEHGTLLRSSHGMIYVLMNDGTWRALPEPVGGKR